VQNINDVLFLPIINTRKEIIHVEQVKSTQEIWHKNKKRFIQISANRIKVGLTSAAAGINAALKGISFPGENSFNISGDYEKTVNSQGAVYYGYCSDSYSYVLCFSVNFESYKQPFLIMSALPLSIIGVSFSLWVFKTFKPRRLYRYNDFIWIDCLWINYNCRQNKQKTHWKNKHFKGNICSLVKKDCVRN
jgi:Cu/Ag efflux pump CusA